MKSFLFGLFTITILVLAIMFVDDKEKKGNFEEPPVAKAQIETLPAPVSPFSQGHPFQDFGPYVDSQVTINTPNSAMAAMEVIERCLNLRTFGSGTGFAEMNMCDGLTEKHLDPEFRLGLIRKAISGNVQGSARMLLEHYARENSINGTTKVEIKNALDSAIQYGDTTAIPGLVRLNESEDKVTAIKYYIAGIELQRLNGKKRWNPDTTALPPSLREVPEAARTKAIKEGKELAAKLNKE